MHHTVLVDYELAVARDAAALLVQRLRPDDTVSVAVVSHPR